jgi:hypothetical protein
MPVRARGLIDTGTDATCVDRAILHRLGPFTPILQTTSQTAGGIVQANLFEVSLRVIDVGNPSAPSLVLPNLLVIEMPSSLPNIDVLIGLDVLLTARLLLDGPNRTITLDF